MVVKSVLMNLIPLENHVRYFPCRFLNPSVQLLKIIIFLSSQLIFRCLLSSLILIEEPSTTNEAHLSLLLDENRSLRDIIQSLQTATHSILVVVVSKGERDID